MHHQQCQITATQQAQRMTNPNSVLIREVAQGVLQHLRAQLPQAYVALVGDFVVIRNALFDMM